MSSGTRFTYDSNNSGGGWWLDDKDWFALELAGWRVHWVALRPDTIPGMDANGRWLGALATKATKDFPSEEMCIEEWQTITGQNPNDEGCHCCGPPHYFRRAWDDE